MQNISVTQEPAKIPRIPSFKTVADFQRHVEPLNIPCDSDLLLGSASPLAQPMPNVITNGKTIEIASRFSPWRGGTPLPRAASRGKSVADGVVLAKAARS